jgi:hypothetical protein
LLNLWWTAYLIGLALIGVGRRTTEAGNANGRALAALASAVVFVTAGIALCQIVLRITQAFEGVRLPERSESLQAARRKRRSGGQVLGPP